MSLSRRHFGTAVAASFAATFLHSPAYATTLRALSLEELKKRSAKVALATPESSTASWESVGGQRRIVTYTRALIHEIWVDQEDAPDGEAQDLHLLTLGGRVGDIQQRVFGEAQLVLDKPCLLFVAGAPSGLRRVVGMAQGQYPLVARGGSYELSQSPGLPPLQRPAGLVAAVDQLRSLDLASARRVVGGSR